MQNTFSSKALWFYGTTLISVVMLFQFTTRYGEANLKAQPKLEGRFISTESLPGCPTNTRWALDIQQSGIYLNGSLQLLDSSETVAVATVEEKPSLKGIWRSPQVTLIGATSAFTACQRLVGSAQAPLSVSIQGNVTPEATALAGQFTLGSAPSIAFTAQFQEPPDTPSSTQGH
jgi:hypothetical protein